MKPEILLSDADVCARLLAYLKAHGPMRAKTLTKTAGTPYERSLRLLDALREKGAIEQVPDGLWHGKAIYAWMIAGTVRAARPGMKRFAFDANETLAAMQAAARTALLRQAA
jgi:DNA-binding IclR family transcriptional regulator